MNKIYADLAQIESTSYRIETALDDYRTIYSNLYNQVDNLGSVWMSDDNRAFTNQIYEFKEDLIRIEMVVKQYAEFLRNSAKGYRETIESLSSSAKQIGR